MQGNIDKKEFLAKGNRKIVFLVWDREGIRAYGISKYIGASLHFLYTSPIRHPVLFIKTLQILRKEGPQIIICQSPPITCAFIAMLYKYLFAWKTKILIDVHTGAISRPWSKNFSRLIMKRASVNIVTNNELKNDLIQNYHIKPIVLEDPIPDFTDILSPVRKPDGYKIQQKSNFNVAVISSFAYDEPLQAVFEAASQLPNMQFYVTGDKTQMDKKLLNNISDNVIMTGFLDYNTYLDLLQKVDVIMDLTTDDKTMLAGAYEAVALEQPLITSNWSPLRRYFNKGTIHINNSSKDIGEAIIIAKSRKDELSKQMHQLKIEKIKEWKEKICKFNYLFN